MNNQINDIYKNLEKWIDHNPASYDLLDIKSQSFYIKVLKLSQKSKFYKLLTAPIILSSERYISLFRKLYGVKKQVFPQAKAIIARAYLTSYKISNDHTSLDKALELLNWLEKNTSSQGMFCWGQPYNWFSRKLIPAGTPRATVSTQVANAFIDAYEITKEEKFLKIAINTCNFFIDHFNWDRDNDGNVCFSYTTLDNYHIHNSNMLVAATLIRTWYYSRIQKFYDFGVSAMNFTIKHQNRDGSWFYWAPPDKIVGKIDNYHTGFVLESFEVIKKYLENKFHADDILEKGIDFYIQNLFENKCVPKLTNKSTYPIDIQSCAQAIITLGEIKNRKPELEDMTIKIANWTIKNFYDKKGYFYYRMYKNGRIDKTPYIRWSESWMLRALTYLIN